MLDRLHTPSSLLRLESDAPGVSGLKWRDHPARPPVGDEVQVRVRAVGLNLRDVLKALAVLPASSPPPVIFGGDVAGTVSAVGPDVVDKRPGDHVMGSGADTFASVVTLPSATLAAKPASLSFAEAATIPIAFLTAMYALHHVARVQRGERVLIHAATGGVGLAAVQLCEQAGAEIFATAGSEPKRALLRARGIRHVMDSRTLDFADEIVRVTGGAGVDVVLNSLYGEFLQRSLQCLGRFGRFVELGKRDIFENTRVGLGAFANNQTFRAVDLEQVPREHGTELLRQVLSDIERGALQPLPRHEFCADQVARAFRLMRSARHVGKVVVLLDANQEA